MAAVKIKVSDDTELRELAAWLSRSKVASVHLSFVGGRWKCRLDGDGGCQTGIGATAAEALDDAVQRRN